METAKITVTSQGTGMQQALAETEQLAKDSGLSTKETLHLRLLGEELFGMVRSIAGDVTALYYAKAEGKAFSLCLDAEVKMTQEMRKQLISVSSQGKNSAAVGFMGKLRDMISVVLLPNNAGMSIMSGFSMGVMSMVRDTDPVAQQASEEAFNWSMKQYKSNVDSKRLESSDAEAAWDELEKSIVANIADEVIVRILDENVRIEVQKSF